MRAELRQGGQQLIEDAQRLDSKAVHLGPCGAAQRVKEVAQRERQAHIGHQLALYQAAKQLCRDLQLLLCTTIGTTVSTIGQARFEFR